jgi:hypothetical protein
LVMMSAAICNSQDQPAVIQLPSIIYMT